MLQSVMLRTRKETIILNIDQRAVERTKEGMNLEIRRFKLEQPDGRTQIFTLMGLDLVPVPGTLRSEDGTKTGEVQIRGEKRTSFRVPVSLLIPTDEINQKTEDFFLLTI